MDKYEIRRLRLQEAINTYCGGKQSELARRIGISDSYVARMLYPEGRDGRKRIGEDMVDKICWALGIERPWFDQPVGSSTSAMYTPTKLTLVTKVSSQELDDLWTPARHETDGELVYIPESYLGPTTESGRVETLEFDHGLPFIYQMSWFSKRNIQPNRVRRLRVSDEGMIPMIYPQDSVLVNLDETTIVDGRLYALRYRDEMRVRYLSRLLDGTLILRAINPAHKDEEVTPEIAAEHIAIIGRVRDRTGDGGM